jgi:hypothetical protein
MSTHRQSVETGCIPPYESFENLSQTITSILFNRASSHPAGWQLPGWPGATPRLLTSTILTNLVQCLTPYLQALLAARVPLGGNPLRNMLSTPTPVRLFDQISWFQWHRPAICLPRNTVCQITRGRVHQALLWIHFKCVLW